MIIIGIDPGTTGAGFGVVKKTKNKFACLDYGVIKVDKKFPHAERLKKIYNELLKLLSKHKPDFLSVETLYFFKNFKTAVAVSEARGVIILAAAKKKIKTKNITPLQVKMGMTGYGRADKKQIQKTVKDLLNLKEIPEPDDAADGLAVAICSFNAGFQNPS